MKKETAKQYDELLKYMIKKNTAWHTNNIIEIGQLFNLSQNEIQNGISIFLADNVFEHFKHPSAPDHDFGIYTVSNKGVHFIYKEGGYTKQLKYKNYDNINKKFTWIRHWVWFIGFIVSLIINILFIISTYF